jgi:Uma2 family endonuclease
MLRLATATIDDSIKPAIEWINGKPVQKLMPTDFHAFIQRALSGILAAWAKITTNGRGKVGTPWRFTIPPNSYKTESLVPDIAYLASYFDLPKAERRYPAVPPDIAVEIRSPDDKPNDVAEKRDFYLWWGVKLVIIVDPEQRTVETQEADAAIAYLTEDDTLISNAFPTLSIPLHDLFAELDEPD